MIRLRLTSFILSVSKCSLSPVIDITFNTYMLIIPNINCCFKTLMCIIIVGTSHLAKVSVKLCFNFSSNNDSLSLSYFRPHFSPRSETKRRGTWEPHSNNTLSLFYILNHYTSNVPASINLCFHRKSWNIKWWKMVTSLQRGENWLQETDYFVS